MPSTSVVVVPVGVVFALFSVVLVGVVFVLIVVVIVVVVVITISFISLRSLETEYKPNAKPNHKKITQKKGYDKSDVLRC